MAAKDKAARKFEDYKLPTKQIYKDKKGSIQRTIPIHKIAKDGIFQIEDAPEGEERTFDKAYIFIDANYVIKDDDEQELYLKQYCKVLNALNVSFKILTMNNNRDMNAFMNETLLRHEADESDIYASLKDTYNEIILDRAKNGRSGIEQVKIFVLTCRRQDFDAARSFFNTMEASLMANFKKLESGLIPLNAEERFKLLHSFYRLGHEGEFKFDFDRMNKAPGKDWLNSIANLYIKEEEEYLKFEDRYVKVLFAEEFPNSSVSDEFINHVNNLPFNIITTMDVSPVPKGVAQKKLLDTYMAVNDAVEKMRESRRKNQQYDSEIPFERRKEMEKAEENLEIARDNDENMFYCALYFVLTARTKEQLESNLQNLVSLADSYSFKISPCYLYQLHGLNTALPTGAREISTMRPIWTQPMSALLPFNIQELHESGGIFYGVNQISKNPLFGDRKRLTNYNGFIFGVPGAGKSVTAKLTNVIQPALETKDDIIIIDPKDREYEFIGNLGGQYISISTKTKNFINPLSVENFSSYRSPEAFISDKASLILGISEQIMTQQITSGHKSIIDRCVRELYKRVLAEKKIREPLMQELYDIFGEQPEPEAREIRLSYELFVNGSLNIFAHKSNVNMKNRIIGFDISELGDDLASVGMLIVLESIRSRVMENKKKGRSTWIVIDEFHHMTERPYTAHKVNQFWKEFRAMGGICTGITQNIVDITALPEIVSMIANSEFIIMLKQGETDQEVIQRVIGLNDNTLEYVTGADPGCGVMKFGNKIIPFDNKLPKDSLLYDIVNTDFHEKIRKKKLNGKQKKALKDEFEGHTVPSDPDFDILIGEDEKLDIYAV